MIGYFKEVLHLLREIERHLKTLAACSREHVDTRTRHRGTSLSVIKHIDRY